MLFVHGLCVINAERRTLLSKFRIVLLACAEEKAEFSEDTHNVSHGTGSGTALRVCKIHGRV